MHEGSQENSGTEKGGEVCIRLVRGKSLPSNSFCRCDLGLKLIFAPNRSNWEPLLSGEKGSDMVKETSEDEKRKDPWRSPRMGE